MKISNTVVRYQLLITGTVQGVGFRPYVYQLATCYGLAGMVSNDGSGVAIEVEGLSSNIEFFKQALISKKPPLAIIDNITVVKKSVQHDADFVIAPSAGTGSGNILVPPDIAVCQQCKQEVANPKDRHFCYPFTNCTNCGPRFTIVQQLPYDRHQTSMAVFPMCSACAEEYADPRDRRFHAQPVACPKCGPKVTLVDGQGRPVRCKDPIAEAAKLLVSGKILAVKGLGGFHLACNATNEQAIAELRRRKGRLAKPFAIMCRDVELVKSYCQMDIEEEKLLQSTASPIVLLQKKENCTLPLQLTGGLRTLGVMLPYTPLHQLLLQVGPPALVMTSGNRNRLPLVIINRQALTELNGIADCFLWHNREIVRRCDDSVISVVGGEKCFIRRSRGYVPQPIVVPIDTSAPVLALGGENKNTFCILNDGKAYLSQHIGAIDTVEGQDNLKESIVSLCDLVGIEPEILAYDSHPQFSGRQIITSLHERWRIKTEVGIQHHHAHLAACMAENNLNQQVIGIVLDGTGYGCDGQFWGFEIVLGDYKTYQRQFYLSSVPLPGGERAIRYPWITATAYLITHMGNEGNQLARYFFANRQKELAIIERMLETGLNAPLSSSCGRLFDAVAALLGLCDENTYEGQAPSKLSDWVNWHYSSQSLALSVLPYQFYFRESEIEVKCILEQVVADIMQHKDKKLIAKRFHDTVLAIIVEGVKKNTC